MAAKWLLGAQHHENDGRRRIICKKGGTSFRLWASESTHGSNQGQNNQVKTGKVKPGQFADQYFELTDVILTGAKPVSVGYCSSHVFNWMSVEFSTRTLSPKATFPGAKPFFPPPFLSFSIGYLLSSFRPPEPVFVAYFSSRVFCWMYFVECPEP